jgi:hypothetical protein
MELALSVSVLTVEPVTGHWGYDFIVTGRYMGALSQ